MAEQEVIDTQEGPQTVAAESDADVLVYGGAAGSGKSYWLCIELLKYVFLAGYVGLLMRRTYADLVGPGTIWEETRGLYPLAGGTEIGSPLHWRFPSGAKIWAKHMAHEKDLEKLFRGTQPAVVALDEATDWPESAFWFLLNRMRTKIGIRPRMRMTCNPDPDHWLAKFLSWWIDDDGYPIEERSGVLRYMLRHNGEIVWADAPKELHKYLDEGERPEDRILSVTFVSAKLTDNKKLLEQDPAYLGKLKMLPPVEQARYLGGNWRAKAAKGDYFQRAWFNQVPATFLEQKAIGAPQERHYIKRVRMYDFASTPVRGDLVPGVERPDGFVARDPSECDPDWSASVLLCETRQGHYAIEDVQRYRDSPGAIRAWVVEQAKRDGHNTLVCLFKDPAQAGQDQFDSYVKALRGIARVVERPTIGLGAKNGTPAKERNARAASHVTYAGKVWYKPSDHLSAFFGELEDFPDKDKHDDWVDAFSGAILALQEIPAPAFEYTPARPGPMTEVDRWGDRTEEEDIDRPGGTAGFERGL